MKFLQGSLPRYRCMIAGRIFLAFGGGYLLAMLVAKVIARGYSSDPAVAAMAASLLGFVVCTAVCVMVFTVNSTRKVWLIMTVLVAVSGAVYALQVN